MLRVVLRTCQNTVAPSSPPLRCVSTCIRKCSNQSDNNQNDTERKDVVYPKVRLAPKALPFGVPDEAPWTRARKAFKFDYDTAAAFLEGKEPPLYPGQSDILIIGGGVVGSSIAYHLSEMAGPGLNVVLVERNPPKNTSLSGNFDLYQQVTSKPNLEMVQYAAEFYRTVGSVWNDPDLKNLPDINLNVNSSLLLGSKEEQEFIVDLSEMYREMKWNHQLSSPTILQQRFPWLNCDGVAVGCLGLHKEGFFNEQNVLNTIRARAKRNGVKFHQANLIGFEFVDISEFSSPMHSLMRTFTPRKALVQNPHGEVQKFTFGYLIIAAGTEINDIVSLLNMNNCNEELPIIPQKLSSFEIQCPSGPGLDMPLIIDPSGLRIRRNDILGTYTVWNEKDVVDHESEEDPKIEDNYFTEKLYPQLIHRLPIFEDCKVLSSKARLVDTCLWDNHLLLGPLMRYHNVLIAGGFRNNDYLFGPAVGRGIAEHCLENQYIGIDLSCFRLERMENNLKINELLTQV